MQLLELPYASLFRVTLLPAEVMVAHAMTSFVRG